MRKLYLCLPAFLFHLSYLTAQVPLPVHFTDSKSGYSLPENKFAANHGVTAQQMKALVDQWAQADSAKNAVAGFMQQGARSYYLQQFRESSLFYEQAAVLREKALQEKFEANNDLTSDALAETDAAYTAWVLAGNSAREGDDFYRAIQLYNKADSILWLPGLLTGRDSAMTAQKRRLQELLAVVLYEQGVRMEDTREGAALLAQAATIEQAALAIYTKERFPQEWARTQSNLGAVLQEQADRVEDDSIANDLFIASVTAYRAALTLYAKKDFPQLWAMTQNNIGVVFRKLGTLREEAAMFERSVTALKAAFEVYTKNDFPQEWALTQNNLGVTLQEQSVYDGNHLLEQAISACGAALEVYTKTRFPQDWALTQYNLGNILQLQGNHTKEPEAAAVLFEQSANAYRLALNIYTQKEAPQAWASTQHSLGLSLFEQGRHSEGTALLIQAVTAFRAALMVRTRECVPEQWARTQYNLGAALWEQSDRTAGDNITLLDQSITAHTAALEIYTKKDFPQQWLETQSNLGLLYEQKKEWAAAIAHFETLREIDPIYAAKKVSEVRRKAQQ